MEQKIDSLTKSIQTLTRLVSRLQSKVTTALQSQKPTMGGISVASEKNEDKLDDDIELEGEGAGEWKINENQR